MIDAISVYGSSPRVTLDGEWTYEELADDIHDECIKLVGEYQQKYKNRAVYDMDLYKPQYLAEKIKDENGDLIEIYNTCADKHRNENVFNIHWFDEWIHEQIRKILKSNLVGDTK